jgi:hypothetical protein
MAAPDGSIAMPGFGGTLSSEARWDLIDYLRAHNAGVSVRTTGKWSHPMPRPQFDIVCAEGKTIDLDDLRGRILRIIAEPSEETSIPLPPTGTDITTIILSRKPTSSLTTAACVASEPETWTTFAILSGVSRDALAGEQVLADQNSWLRVLRRPGYPGDLSNPQALRDTIRDIAAQPLAVDTTGAHVHRH